MRKSLVCLVLPMLLGTASLGFAQGNVETNVEGEIDPMRANRTVTSIECTPRSTRLGQEIQARWTYNDEAVGPSSRFRLYAILPDGRQITLLDGINSETRAHEFELGLPGTVTIGIAPLDSTGNLRVDTGATTTVTVTPDNRPPTVNLRATPPSEVVGGQNLAVLVEVSDPDATDTLTSRFATAVAGNDGSNLAPAAWQAIDGTNHGRGNISLELLTPVVTSPTRMKYRIVTNDGTASGFSNVFEVLLKPGGRNTPPPPPPSGGARDGGGRDTPPVAAGENHPPQVTGASVLPDATLESGQAFTISFLWEDADAGDDVVGRLQRKDGDVLSDLPDSRPDGYTVSGVAPINSTNAAVKQLYVLTITDSAGATAEVELELTILPGHSTAADLPVGSVRLTLRRPSLAQEARDFDARGGAPEPSEGTTTFHSVVRDGRTMLVTYKELTDAELADLRARARRYQRNRNNPPPVEQEQSAPR